MTRTTPRVCRKARPCSSSPCRMIQPGEKYLEHVCSPWHDDIGNDRWWRLAECSDCAERYGRGHLLTPSAFAEVPA